MEWLYLSVGFVIGAIFVAVIAWWINRHNRSALIETIKSEFNVLSSDALGKSSELFLNLAEQRMTREREQHASQLDGKKQLIDQQLEKMTSELDKVKVLVNEFEKNRAEKLGALGKELENLTRTSSQLQRALADNRSRGQWGERIAEDILKLAGMEEGTSYTKQETSQNGHDKKNRPDFTFRLPNGLKLNMDSKFPLDNYLKHLDAEADTDKKKYSDDFIKDVRKCIKDTVERNYINGETVDCVLVFIPNEQIYRFVHETDQTVIDEALRKKVVLCSPLTLIAVLAVIRQAAEHLQLEQSSKAILQLLGDFMKQWEDYVKEVEKIGDALDKAHKAYNEVVGTRRQRLEKQLAKIDKLRSQQGDEGQEVPVLTEINQ